MSLHHVYTLPLKDGCFYVGSTTDPIERLTSHLSGTGSKWTMAHPVVGSPIRLATVNGNGTQARLDEDAEVKRMMNIHGIDKVRGGSYCQEVLPDEQISALQIELNHANNNCLRCGRKGHFASNCFAINDSNGTRIPPRAASNLGAAEAPTRGVCYRCGREGHFADECYAKSDMNGRPIFDHGDDEFDEYEFCDRCGREGHFADECYAKSDVNGHPMFDDDDDDDNDDEFDEYDY
jgi:predicted GIY-YIG superfamily endonuclease/ribosomal protein L37E